MNIEDTLRRTKTITFDCYGTLIDWAAGLTASFREVFGSVADECMDELFAAYVPAEATIEAEGYKTYREVLAGVTVRLGERFGVNVPDDRRHLLADQLPDWPPFPDTCEALARLKQRYRLGVLSNVDRDLFAGTASRLGVAFDFVVTAQDVGSYKPRHPHFERMLAEHAEADSVLHVAQSLYHDGGPCKRLGLAYVWINRYNDPNETNVEPLAVFPDLKSLADAADQT